MPTYTKEQIKEQLKVNNVWVFRAVVAIYNYQTATEQAAETTHEDNGVGFNGVDAGILTSFAKQIKRWESTNPSRRHPTPLSPKQLTIARNKIQKYSGQLAKIANGEI